MNMPMTQQSWREFAQIRPLGIVCFSNRINLSRNIAIAGTELAVSACTSQYRYPSPTTWFGPLMGRAIFFLPRAASALTQKRQDVARFWLELMKNSCSLLFVLNLVSIKTTIKGRLKCRSNTGYLRYCLLPRFRHVWTMMSNVRPLVRLQVRLFPMSQMAASLPVRSLVQAPAHYATTLNCANRPAKKTNTLNTIDETAIAAFGPRWFLSVNAASHFAFCAILAVYGAFCRINNCAKSTEQVEKGLLDVQ